MHSKENRLFSWFRPFKTLQLNTRFAVHHCPPFFPFIVFTSFLTKPSYPRSSQKIFSNRVMVSIDLFFYRHPTFSRGTSAHVNFIFLIIFSTICGPQQRFPRVEEECDWISLLGRPNFDSRTECFGVLRPCISDLYVTSLSTIFCTIVFRFTVAGTRETVQSIRSNGSNLLRRLGCTRAVGIIPCPRYS